MNTRALIEEVISLPVEERVSVINSLLRSLNTPDADIDKEWAVVARQRLEEIRSGSRTARPGDEVLARARNRFA